MIAVDSCIFSERVCHSRENGPQDFFYVYTCLFTYLHITFSFDEFTMGVLRIPNVALTQLHPNSWATFQAFRLICDLCWLRSSHQSFSFYYNSCLDGMGWLSLSSRPGSILFVLFTLFYKNFKSRYFKIFVVFYVYQLSYRCVNFSGMWNLNCFYTFLSLLTILNFIFVCKHNGSNWSWGG